MKIKEILCKSLWIQLTLISVMGMFVYAEDAEEWMPDTTLRNAIREKLQLPDTTPLSLPDMLKITDLVVLESDIANLQGLEHAINLSFLHLSRSRIVDLTPLKSLMALEVLKLYANDIMDITALAGLVNLRVLELNHNRISDFSPLRELRNLKVLSIHNNVSLDMSLIPTSQLIEFTYDWRCDTERTSFSERIRYRTYPSVFSAWGGIINMPTVSVEELLAYHDLQFSDQDLLGLHWRTTSEGLKLVGNFEEAKGIRDRLLTLNPNMLILASVKYLSGINALDHPQDWELWLRDENGTPIIDPLWNHTLIDFTLPEAQDWVIEQVVAIAKCGLFDGIFLDSWNEHSRLGDYRTREAEHAARDVILQRIREVVGEDYLILVNSNHSKIPRWAPYVNGLFMETRPGYSNKGINSNGGYSDGDLDEIQETLLWAEHALREPHINCLEGVGVGNEPPNSSQNRQWMRFFTTMSLTHSDGYVVFVTGIHTLNQHLHQSESDYMARVLQVYGHQNIDSVGDSDHYWYDFYDADLDRPIGEKAQLYENREGLFIREFTNGWAVYNRSGKAQEVEFPEVVSGVASGVKEKRSHVLPDLDGEIYLKSESQLETSPTADINGDGIVNVLDLVLVANALGEEVPDLNGDGVVNILDLVIVANAFE